MGVFGKFRKNKTGHEKLRENLLNKVEVYAKATHYLLTCGSPFDAKKFEQVDNILDQAGVSLGPAKRAQMMQQSKFILPSRTPDGKFIEGGTEAMKMELIKSLIQGFKIWNESLMRISPDKDTAQKVIKILNKYKMPK